MRSWFRKIQNRFFRKISDPQIMESAYVSKDSQVGDYTYIGFNCFISKAKIGRYCSIANNVSIGLGEHDLKEISTSSYFYENAYEKLTEKECEIGHDVWIGVDVIIRRGVKIGHGAVIGANSFVNEDVPDFAVVAGTPAKLIKYRFTADQIASIQNSNWWSYELPEARTIIENLKSKVL